MKPFEALLQFGIYSDHDVANIIKNQDVFVSLVKELHNNKGKKDFCIHISQKRFNESIELHDVFKKISEFTGLHISLDLSDIEQGRVIEFPQIKSYIYRSYNYSLDWLKKLEGKFYVPENSSVMLNHRNFSALNEKIIKTKGSGTLIYGIASATLDVFFSAGFNTIISNGNEKNHSHEFDNGKLKWYHVSEYADIFLLQNIALDAALKKNPHEYNYDKDWDDEYNDGWEYKNGRFKRYTPDVPAIKVKTDVELIIEEKITDTINIEK